MISEAYQFEVFERDADVYQFEVFERDADGSAGEFYASGEAGTIEEVRQLAREYTCGDFASFVTAIYRRALIESF